MSDATAQLVVGLLFRRGVFFISRGIKEDVLGNFFSSKDLLWEKIMARNKRRWIMRLQLRAKERIEKENLLSNCSLLWWVLLSSIGFFPLSAMALGFFSSREAGREDMR
jgi:hypothetical protein